MWYMKDYDLPGIGDHEEPERELTQDETCELWLEEEDPYEECEWVDTRDTDPLDDGIYLVQMAGNYITAMTYTTDGGWNTHRRKNGTVETEDRMDSISVVRWFAAPEPPAIPDAWIDEWLRR